MSKVQADYKFKIGDLVHINVTCQSKRHFETDVIAVLGRSYGQTYGYNDRESFSVLIIDRKALSDMPDFDRLGWAMRQPVYAVSWYEPSEFTLLEEGNDASELWARRKEDRV